MHVLIVVGLVIAFIVILSWEKEQERREKEGKERLSGALTLLGVIASSWLIIPIAYLFGLLQPNLGSLFLVFSIPIVVTFIGFCIVALLGIVDERRAKRELDNNED